MEKRMGESLKEGMEVSQRDVMLRNRFHSMIKHLHSRQSLGT